MTSNYRTDDPILGQIDLDDYFIRDQFLIDQFVGSTLFGWGDNSRDISNLSGTPAFLVTGEVGNNNNPDRMSSPVQIGSAQNWRFVSGQSQSGGYSGGRHAIRTDGTLWVWGFNENGELGFGDNGATPVYYNPTQLGTARYINSCFGTYLMAGVRTDGTLWTWGINWYGSLGLGVDGGQTVVGTPTQVGGLRDWRQVSSGYLGGKAIKTNGTLWAWGLNNLGQLGLNNTTNRSSPTQVGTLTNWREVVSGSDCCFAVKTDGTLWAWGHNNYGQLGLGNLTHRSSPVQVGTLNDWRYVACGGSQWNGVVQYTGDPAETTSTVLAIKTNGTLWAWGLNTYGQLGLGNLTHRSSPVQVGSLSNWKQVSVGYRHVLAVKTDGTLWAWGENVSVTPESYVGPFSPNTPADTWRHGALGTGNLTNYSSPVQVGSLSNWKAIIAAGVSSHGILFKDI